MNRRYFLSVLASAGWTTVHGCSPDRDDRSSFEDRIDRSQIRTLWTRHTESFEFGITESGALIVDIAGDWYIVESSFVGPNQPLGPSKFSASLPGTTGNWRIRVRDISESQVEISAEGVGYSVLRTIAVQGGRLKVSDQVTNTSAADIAIGIEHDCSGSDKLPRILLAGGPQDLEGNIAQTVKNWVKKILRSIGMRSPSVITHTAENPTLHVTQARSNVGLAMEDTLSRLKTEMVDNTDRSTILIQPVALGAGQQRSFNWSLYPSSSDGDYFEFINRVRGDWDVNFTIYGPYTFFDVVSDQELLSDPSRLRAFIERYRIKIVALTPWLDYDNFNWRTGRPLSREDYKTLMQNAHDAFKEVDPEIACVGCMESNLVLLPPEIGRALFDALPSDQREAGIFLSESHF